MPKYLVHFAQFHEPFRLPELLSLAKIESISMQYDPKNYSDSNPFLIIELQNNADAIKLIRRSILVKQIVELWACEQTPDKLKESIQKTGFTERDVYKTSSFKFLVDSFGNSLSIGDQIKKMNTFAWMGFKGLVDLNDPDVCFAYYEDYSGETYAGKKRTNPPSRLFFGVLLATGNRSIVAQYDLKKRDYLGTTSMDAELSLIMANQALAGPGSIVLDPFVGTGSFLVSCSHFGAYTIGADIDGRQIRGADGRGIENNLTQYKLDNLVLGTLVCDIAHHPWRSGEWFDAIVCDPPYGVRAGAKKIASTNRSAYKKNGELRYPTMEVYEMSLVISDLISFAATHLNVNGRLVFWLPTLIDEYTPEDIPSHSKMRVIANSEQNFGKWSRRLVTMEKIDSLDALAEELVECAVSQPGHSNFREKYFNVDQSS